MCPCPSEFPAGYFWYGSGRKGPGRPPRWVDRLLSTGLASETDPVQLPVIPTFTAAHDAAEDRDATQSHNVDVDELSPSHCNIGIRETQKEGTGHLEGDVATSEGSLQGDLREQPGTGDQDHSAWEELPMPPSEGMDVQRSHTPGQDQPDTTSS